MERIRGIIALCGAARRRRNEREHIAKVLVYAASAALDDALDELRGAIEESMQEGYELLGGISLACDGHKFYVMQTLVKKVEE